ncbi:hypothetical protein EDD25_2938 [Cryobacterium psychrophilum]|nr:hypothetical protein EDD25_2938 [Cryobacterium psychrophilum]
MRSPIARAMAVVLAVGPPVTLITALLFYFGWARADAQARMMGLDVSLFGYTGQDYILRSVTSLFLPLIGLLVVAMVSVSLERALHRRAHDGRGSAAIARGALFVITAGGLGAAVLAVALVTLPGNTRIVGPYVLASLVWIVAAAVRLRRHALGVLTGEQQRVVDTTLVIALITMLLFWGTTDFAQIVGRGLAANYERSVPTLPHASVYSEGRLSIDVPTVTETNVGTADAPLYRYSGLRLLVVSGGRYFFLHDGWTLNDGTVVVLPDNTSVRVEFGN